MHCNNGTSKRKESDLSGGIKRKYTLKIINALRIVSFIHSPDKLVVQRFFPKDFTFNDFCFLSFFMGIVEGGGGVCM